MRNWLLLLLLAIPAALAAMLLVPRLIRRRDAAGARLARPSRDGPPLAGVSNRHQLGQRMAQLADAGPAVGLVVLRLDHFERIDERFGEGSGDAVLVEVARRLRGLLRDRDMVVRWSGGEFVLVLPDTAGDGPAALAGRVLRVIGGAPVRCRDRAVPVTVSIGSVAHPLAPARSWEEALRLADAALHLARQSGCNQGKCIVRIDADAVDGSPSPDLLRAAQRAGSVVLETVPGPASLAIAKAKAPA